MRNFRRIYPLKIYFKLQKLKTNDELKEDFPPFFYYRKCMLF